MMRQALCVGGTVELHTQLASAYAAVDVKLRVIPKPLVGKDVEAFKAVDQDADIFVWAAAESNDANVESVTVENFRAYLDRTIHSAFQMMQACLVGMERRRFGRILALTNMNSHLGDEDILSPTVSGGLEGLIRSVAREGALLPAAPRLEA